jgi:hypothetical protein
VRQPRRRAAVRPARLLIVHFGSVEEPYWSAKGYNVLDAALPSRGYKQFGWSREHGHAGFDAYTELKTVVVPKF